MRKTTSVFALLLLAAALTAAGNQFAVRLSVSEMYPADANYRDIYGKYVLLPRLELACNFSATLSAWAAYGGLKKNGLGPLTSIECSSAQHFLTAGAAYTAAVSESAALRLAAGPLLVFYREKAGTTTVSGNALGADIHAALSWTLSRGLALEGSCGYLLAADRVDGGDSFKLGGLWGGLGLAVNF